MKLSKLEKTVLLCHGKYVPRISVDHAKEALKEKGFTVKCKGGDDCLDVLTLKTVVGDFVGMRAICGFLTCYEEAFRAHRANERRKAPIAKK